MSKRKQREEGFKAGKVFGSLCPYPEGSEEARQWDLGWAEGVLSRSADEGIEEYPQSSFWHRLVKRLRGN